MELSIFFTYAFTGLLNFWSEPFGLVTSEFVAGTKDAVTAYYTASCCDPKIDILASDLRGNTNRVTLNIEHRKKKNKLK